MSKLFLRSLYLMLLTLCLPSMASAETVAKIGTAEYETLAAAVTAANAGETVSIVTAGTYTLPGIPKNITIEGGVDGVVFNHTTAGSIASIPNGATFENVTFNLGNENYHGFQHPGTINMERCTLNGKLFSYGDMNFTNCQFKHSDDYHMWVYGPGTVTYTNCTFTNNGKFLHLYRESPDNVAVVNIKNCKFINNGSTANKAAVNVKATSGSNILSNTVNIDDESTTVGAFPEPGVRNNSDNTDVISSLVQVDDRKVAASSEKITVNVENVPVYQNGAETEVVGINTVEEFKAFRDAVNSGTTPYAGKIVRLMADLDLSSEANWTPIGNLVAYPGQSFQGTFDGNGHIISNLTVNDNTPNYAVAALFGSIAEGSIVNLTVKDVNVTSTHYAAGIVAYTSNTPSIINCHVVGGTITSTPELVGSSYDNGDKAGGIMGYCTTGTTIKDCTVEGVTITAYRDLAGICGYAKGAVTDCTVKDVTVVQDNTNAYLTEDVAYTACEVVGGRSANLDATNAANTTENVTVKTVAPVAKIGTTQYGTLQAAIDAAQAGDVVELLKDFDLTTVTTSPSDKYNVNINKSITIDGKGYKVTSSAGKRAIVLTEEGNNITLKNLTVVNNKAEACLWIANNLTCTLDAVTLDGTNGKTYNQPLTIGSIDDEGRVTLNVTNGSVIKTNDAGSAHYAILAAHPADITVTNSSLIGWANVYLKPDAAGSKVNISNSTLKSQGIAGASASNNFSMFTTESGNNTITLTDNNISLAPAADTYMTLVTFNGTANNTVKVEGAQTTFTTTDVTRGGITHSKGDLESNTVSFDEDAHSAFAEAINVLKNEGVSDTEAEGVYTLGYVAEVYYYWFANGVEAGGNYDFAEPFKNGWLVNGEYIRLRKNVTLSENITWAEKNASFTLTLGDFSVTKGEYSVALKAGVSVNTDKQTDIFTAADAAYTVKETAVEGGYTYAVVERSFVAQIGETKYETLEEAIAAAEDGQTVTLLADCAGNGISINKSLTIDFATYTYTITGPSLAGSAGTKTQAFQLLKNNTITFKNGAIVGNNSDVKMLIQNYSNLTLDNMTLDATQGNNSVGYVLSTNNGSTTIKDTKITAKTGGTAFDACSGWGGYTSNAVEVTGTSVITGNVEVSYYGETGTNPATLTLTSGTLNGDIVMARGADQTTVTKANTFEQAAPAGYKWVADGENTSKLVAIDYVAQIGTTKYETLEEAIAAAQDGDEVTLLADCSGNGIVAPQGKFANGLTVDFNGKTYTITGPSLAGSTGTKTQAFQLLKGNTVTFKNGAIVGDNSDVKMLIQNYSNLTLDNMTLDATQGNNSVGYVLSTNNGSTTIKDTKITAKTGGTAFDACSGWGGYTSNAVEVTGNSVITGNVEVSYYGQTGTNPAALTLTSGTLTGDIVMAQGADQATVTKADAFEQDAPEGYEWKDNGNGTSTLVEATDIELANNGDNSAVITAANGKVRNVTLKGRTLYKDNCWNTICLPFDVTIDAESPLAGATVKELDAANSGYVAATNVLRINFKDAETDNDGNVVLKANTPYLLKWTSGNNVVAPVFNGVTVESGEAKAVSSDGELEFVGTASTVTLEGTKYAYFGNNNKLLYVDAPAGKKIYTCRAYFYLPNQDFKAALDETSGAKSFVLSFGDDDDDITRVAAVAGQQKAEDDVYYDLQGRKIVGQPTVSGIYVKNGVKVYVK